MLKRLVSFFALFTSMGTLVCCALPALFVSLGLGATFVSVLGVFPQLIWLSEHKRLVFSIAGAMLAVAEASRRLSQKKVCPTDRGPATTCAEARGASNVIFYVSVGLYCVGVFFAFVAPRIF